MNRANINWYKIPTRRKLQIALAIKYVSEFTGDQAIIADRRLNIVQWIIRNRQMTIDELKTGDRITFHVVCANNHLDVAKMLAKVCSMTPLEMKGYNNYPLKIACYYGYLELAKWIASESQQTVADQDQLTTIDAACKQWYDAWRLTLTL